MTTNRGQGARRCGEALRERAEIEHDVGVRQRGMRVFFRLPVDMLLQDAVAVAVRFRIVPILTVMLGQKLLPEVEDRMRQQPAMRAQHNAKQRQNCKYRPHVMHPTGPLNPRSVNNEFQTVLFHYISLP